MQIANWCRFRFQCGTGGVREIKALREMSPAAFSVSIESGSTFFRFQLGLIYRLIDRPMNACRVRVFAILRSLPLRRPSVLSVQSLRTLTQATDGITAKVFSISTSSPWKRLDRGRSKSATRMWRAGNPHLSERPFSPDGADFFWFQLGLGLASGPN